MTDIKYIEVTGTTRIEVMPSGNHYPQHLSHPELIGYTEAWSYWRTGNQQKHFKTEAGARKFLASQK